MHYQPIRKNPTPVLLNTPAHLQASPSDVSHERKALTATDTELLDALLNSLLGMFTNSTEGSIGHWL